MLVTKQLKAAIDLVQKNTMEVNGYRQLFGYYKKETHIDLDQVEGE